MFVQSFHSFIRSLVCSICLSGHSLIHSFIRLFVSFIRSIRLFVLFVRLCLFGLLFVRSLVFVRSIVSPFVHSFIRAFNHPHKQRVILREGVGYRGELVARSLPSSF